VIKLVPSFASLLSTPFEHGTNALCWSRSLPGDYAEVVRQLGPGEGIVALDEERLRGLRLEAGGVRAVDQMLADLALLREAGRDPVLNIVYGYPKDEDGGPVPTDVLSWHVDSAPVEADTWLCTYHGAPSEGLLNDHALRKVDDPKIRAELLDLYHQSNGADPQGSGLRFQVSAFEEWLTENHYDLHYAALPGAKPYPFGVGPLWRIAIEWPGNRLSLQNPQVCTAISAPSAQSGLLAPVSQSENRGQTPGWQQPATARSQVSVSLPCVHRAPVSDTPRLLLIS
jgi:hypothetical protein